jgi:hypothetical protein
MPCSKAVKEVDEFLFGTLIERLIVVNDVKGINTIVGESSYLVFERGENVMLLILLKDIGWVVSEEESANAIGVIKSFPNKGDMSFMNAIESAKQKNTVKGLWDIVE